jgi:crossover junction endodeoxyribonuclease RuvC
MHDTLQNILLNHRVQLAVIEHVSAMPGQGVVSMFSFGQNFGWWLGMLEAFNVPTILVRPQAWQKALGVPKKAAKTDKPSLDVARRLFPSVDLHRKKDHGKADALLLAYYASQKGAA